MGADDDTVVLDGIIPYVEPDWYRAAAQADRPGGRRGGRRGTRRAHGLWFTGALLLFFIGVFGAGAGLGLVPGAPGLPAANQAGAAPGARAASMSRSEPTRITISAISVQAPVMSVGLAADGAIGTPPLGDRNLAGWYAGGPAPGEEGSAVIVGHVDGPAGESVFYRLDALKPGDTIKVTRADKKTAVFTVYSVEYYPKGAFPGQKVYGDDGRPDLRLITCGGAFLGGDSGYADNVVAYATLSS